MVHLSPYQNFFCWTCSHFNHRSTNDIIMAFFPYFISTLKVKMTKRCSFSSLCRWSGLIGFIMQYHRQHAEQPCQCDMHAVGMMAKNSRKLKISRHSNKTRWLLSISVKGIYQSQCFHYGDFP